MSDLTAFIVTIIATTAISTGYLQNSLPSASTKQTICCELQNIQDSLQAQLSNSLIVVKSGLNKESLLLEHTNSILMYASEGHCRSCVESIIEEVISFDNKQNRVHVTIIYSVSNLNNYYSLKKQLNGTNISVKYIVDEPEWLLRHNSVFFFAIDQKSSVHSVFIPEGNQITIKEYFESLLNKNYNESD